MRTLKEKNPRSAAHRKAKVAPLGYCSSSTLRERLNITIQQLRTLTHAGVIAATKYNDVGFALYSDEDVQSLLNKQADGSLFAHLSDETSYSAEDSAKVFELLEDQVPLQQIIVKTRLLPQAVKRIQREYADILGSVVVPESILIQMNQLRARLSGPFPLRSATDILTVLTMAAEDRTCSQCDAASCASLCMTCIRSRANGTNGHTNGHANGSSSSTGAVPPALPSQNVRQP